VTVTPDVYERCGAAIFRNSALIIEGIAERRRIGMLMKAQALRPL